MGVVKEENSLQKKLLSYFIIPSQETNIILLVNNHHKYVANANPSFPIFQEKTNIFLETNPTNKHYLLK